MDIFYYKGAQYLHILNAYSGYVWTQKFQATLTTEKICQTLEEVSNVAGYPEQIFSDLGPQFLNAFGVWCEELGISHITSSAYFASSIGAIELSLKSLKLLMYKRDLEQKGKLEDAVNILNHTPCTLGILCAIQD